jgi:4-oxalocrotonate tautomerase
MPLVDIHLIEGVFDNSQKQAMINKVTNAMVEVEGEAMRGVTWVRVYEVASGEWAIGGKALSAADVKAMQAPPGSNGMVQSPDGSDTRRCLNHTPSSLDRARLSSRTRQSQ